MKLYEFLSNKMQVSGQPLFSLRVKRSRLLMLLTKWQNSIC